MFLASTIVLKMVSNVLIFVYGADPKRVQNYRVERGLYRLPQYP